MKKNGKNLNGKIASLEEKRKERPEYEQESRARLTLPQLCALVINGAAPYEDVAECIEDKSYMECEHGKLDGAVSELEKLALFFENIENKNEEISRDLSDIYLLMGQLYQYAGRFDDSINWFTRAIIVDDQYPVPYHSLAVSYQKLENIEGAVRSLEQEIAVSPGNYYTYLLLADLYKKQNRSDMVEDCLRRLLERDQENIQGIHKMIRFYEEHDPSVDVELLVRRILGANREMNKIEAVIKTYYLCRQRRYSEALELISHRSKESPDLTTVHLVKAYIYGEMRAFTKKRTELAAFRKKNMGHEDIMHAKMKEFGSIFGDQAAKRLTQRLVVSNLASRYEIQT